MKTYKITLSDSQIIDLSEFLIHFRKTNLLNLRKTEDEIKDFRIVLKKVIDANFNCRNKKGDYNFRNKIGEFNLSYSQLGILMELCYKYQIHKKIYKLIDDLDNQYHKYFPNLEED